MVNLSHTQVPLSDDKFYFSPKNLRVRIKDNNTSPHGKFHRFLFPFSRKFPDLNFSSNVLYIYPCYVTLHTQWGWVTCGTSSLKVCITQRSRWYLCNHAKQTVIMTWRHEELPLHCFQCACWLVSFLGL